MILKEEKTITTRRHMWPLVNDYYEIFEIHHHSLKYRLGVSLTSMGANCSLYCYTKSQREDEDESEGGGAMREGGSQMGVGEYFVKVQSLKV